jgi:SAM-dependent methyltransferase
MVDLGMHPPCESFLTEAQLEQMEPFYPLHVRVCGKCFLAQIGEYVSPEEIFDDYAYFSSYSTSWLEHAERYVKMMIRRFALDSSSRVLEIASNDGYLLQYFKNEGIEVLGVDPSSNVAEVAIEKGIPTRVEFFNAETATRLVAEGFTADVLLGNNVLAHTPDINGFAAGVLIALAPGGVATFEFPHIMNLIAENQFDTIYHEHWSYLSLGTTQQILAEHGMTVFDVEELETHGGSLRLFLRHAEDDTKPVSGNVSDLLEREREFGLFDLDTYRSFGERVEETKRKLLALLIEAKSEGKSIAVYGAAGKGNTLLNYCGIGPDFIDYACDRNPYKHGRYTPGAHIPIFDPERIRQTKPDLVLILPWNLKDEIMKQLSYISEWGGRFVIPIPEAAVFEAVAE